MHIDQNNETEFDSRMQTDKLLNAPSSTYVEKSKELEDASSTASIFLIVSIGGFLLIGAMWLDFLPFIVSYMKGIYTVTLGAMFLFFFITGLKSYLRIKTLKVQAADEKELCENILSFFKDNYKKEEISTEEEDKELSIEQLYYLRLERMKSLLDSKFKDLDSSFAEFILETVYQTYYEA